MKYTFLSLLTLLFTHDSFSQPNRGCVILNGGVRYSLANTDVSSPDGKHVHERSYTSLFGGVRAGYAFAKHIAAGLVFGVNYIENTITSKDPYVIDLYAAKSYIPEYGVFGRVYRPIGASKFAFLGEVQFLYGMGKTLYESAKSGSIVESTSSRIDFLMLEAAFMPGLTFFINDRLALETTFGQIGYTKTKTTEHDTKGNAGDPEVSTRIYAAVDPGNFIIGLTFFIGGASAK